jgi:type I restriction enzyme, S subunit
MKLPSKHTLRELSFLITKGTTPTSVGHSFANEGINFVKAEAITREGRIDSSTFAFISEKAHLALKRSQIESNDILLTIAGIYLGKVSLIRASHLPANTNQAVAIIRINPQLAVPEFIRYYLFEKSMTKYLNMLCPQSAQPNLNLTQLGNLKILLPDITTQSKIAAVLTAYDDLIETNKKRIEILEKMAEELYREWFVRMRFPGYKNTKFVKGVPEGWSEVKLNAICSEASISTKAGDHLSDRFYLPLDLLSTKQMLPDSHYDYTSAKSSLSLFEEGDILFGAMRPYQHKVVVAPFKGVTRTTMFVIRPKEKYLNSYCYLNLFQDSSIDYATLICNGSDRPYTVWKRGFERMKVFLPSVQILKDFNNLTSPILEEIRSFYFIQRNLSETRDLLLPRLISGKLSVEDLDIQFPPSMREEEVEPELAHA